MTGSKDNRENPVKVKRIPMEKYLMEIKELPTYQENNLKDDLDKPTKSGGQEIQGDIPVADNKPQKQGKEPEIVQAPYREKDVKENKDPEGKQNGEASEVLDEGPVRIFSTKDIIINVINAISVLILVVLLNRLPQKAQELQNLRMDNIRFQNMEPSDLPDISEMEVKSGKLKELFLNHSGVIDFIKPLDELKKNGGTVVNYLFPREDAAKDKSGNYSLPVMIEMRGNLDDIKRDIAKIESLPFLFRPASVEIAPGKDDPSVIECKYGGFLYVDDKLGEIR